MTAPSPSSPADFFACDFFALFGLPRQFALDEKELAAKIRDLQAAVHPDRFAAAGAAQIRAAAQMAARVNQAADALRRPLSRAAYLLSLRGAEAFDETNTAMPSDFLMRQLEWREAAETARENNDRAALTALRAEAEDERRTVADRAAELLDRNRPDDLAAACDAVRKWQYLEKFLSELNAA